MTKTVNVYLFGKRYAVPENLTIMTAMEYAGYQLKRGCGCRNGFCGACATVYRIKGQQELKMALACQTQVLLSKHLQGKIYALELTSGNLKVTGGRCAV